jgi:hypothetical protein
LGLINIVITEKRVILLQQFEVYVKGISLRKRKILILKDYRKKMSKPKPFIVQAED